MFFTPLCGMESSTPTPRKEMAVDGGDAGDACCIGFFLSAHWFVPLSSFGRILSTRTRGVAKVISVAFWPNLCAWQPLPPVSSYGLVSYLTTPCQVHYRLRACTKQGVRLTVVGLLINRPAVFSSLTLQLCHNYSPVPSLQIPVGCYNVISMN